MRNYHHEFEYCFLTLLLLENNDTINDINNETKMLRLNVNNNELTNFINIDDVI